MPATETIVRESAHAQCDHPKTKAARAQCRRHRQAGWSPIVLGDDRVEKGIHVRVHTEGGVDEGTLLGWGRRKIVIRDTDGDRVTWATESVLKVEMKDEELD